MPEIKYPYKIYLKGPWQYFWVGLMPQTAEFLGEGTVRLPTSWTTLFGNAIGKVRFQRAFHRPTNLEKNEHVFLVFEGVGGLRNIFFNKNEMMAETNKLGRFSCEVEITDLLQPFNQLELVIERNGSERENEPVGVRKPVRLEIRKGECL